MAVDPNNYRYFVDEGALCRNRIDPRFPLPGRPEVYRESGEWVPCPLCDPFHSGYEITLAEARRRVADPEHLTLPVTTPEGGGDDAEREGERAADEVPLMATETEIREAGLAIDVPFDAPPAVPRPLRYSDGRTLAEAMEEAEPERFAGLAERRREMERSATLREDRSADERASGADGD